MFLLLSKKKGENNRIRKLLVAFKLINFTKWGMAWTFTRLEIFKVFLLPEISLFSLNIKPIRIIPASL